MFFQRGFGILFSPNFFLLLLKPVIGLGQLTCAQNFNWRSEAVIADSSCTNADLCFVSGAADSSFFSRRGCISGYTYFPLTYGCTYDSQAFIYEGEKTPWGYFCVCNETNCNLPNPVVKKLSDVQVEIEIGEKTLPTDMPPNVTCYAYSSDFVFNGHEADVLITPTIRTPRPDTTCRVNMEIQLKTKKPPLKGTFIVDGGKLDLDQFYRIQIANATFPPFYFGLFVSYQYEVERRYYDFACNYSMCTNPKKNVGNIAVNHTTKCYVGLSNADTCLGHLCFYATDGPAEHPNKLVRRGCLSQDFTLAYGRIEVGVMKFTATHYICADDLCNKDTKTALKSIEAYVSDMEPFVPYVRPIPASPNATIATTTEIGMTTTTTATATTTTATTTTMTISTTTPTTTTTTTPMISTESAQTTIGEETTQFSTTIEATTKLSFHFFNPFLHIFTYWVSL